MAPINLLNKRPKNVLLFINCCTSINMNDFVPMQEETASHFNLIDYSFKPNVNLMLLT